MVLVTSCDNLQTSNPPPAPCPSHRAPCTVHRAPCTLHRAPCTSSRPHCTFADTAAGPVIANAHVFLLLPPLEHAPDQIASRPPDTLSVIEVPLANDADPELPTDTLMPAGLA